MADEQNLTQEQKNELQTQSPGGTMNKVMPWLITAIAVIACATAGFVVSRTFGTRSPAQAASAAEQTPPAETVKQETPPPLGGKGQSWFYDMDPAVANLNEPGVTRYVRVLLTLEVSGSMKEDAGRAFFDQKKPLMKHWLTLYLANQTVDSIRGERNLRLVQGQIADTLNQGLFPNARGQIVRVLFKELSIQ